MIITRSVVLTAVTLHFEKWQRNKDIKMREVEDSQMSPNIYKTDIPKMRIEQMKQKKKVKKY